jgi:hypothetical protein
MWTKLFDEEIILNESINTETKLLICQLKHKILELSDFAQSSVGVKKWNSWIEMTEFFESILNEDNK